jgi:hypothetical protein
MVYQYSDVMDGSVAPKTNGPVTWIQCVSWDNAPGVNAMVNFLTIGITAVCVPPTLPYGFRMEEHLSWATVRDRILEGYLTAEFDRLDLMKIDLESLEKLTGCRMGDDFIPYDERPDWLDWSCSFDGTWTEMEWKIEQLFRRAWPHMPTHSSHQELRPQIRHASRLPLPIV